MSPFKSDFIFYDPKLKNDHEDHFLMVKDDGNLFLSDGSVLTDTGSLSLLFFVRSH